MQSLGKFTLKTVKEKTSVHSLAYKSLPTFTSNALVLAGSQLGPGFCWTEETASPLPLPGQWRSPGAGIRSPKGSWMMPPPPERVGASSGSAQKRHRCTAAAAGAKPQPRTLLPQSHACAPKPPGRARASRRRDGPSLARLAPCARGWRARIYIPTLEGFGASKVPRGSQREKPRELKAVSRSQ